jgi:hypothetical protein
MHGLQGLTSEAKVCDKSRMPIYLLGALRLC